VSVCESECECVYVKTHIYIYMYRMHTTVFRWAAGVDRLLLSLERTQGSSEAPAHAPSLQKVGVVVTNERNAEEVELYAERVVKRARADSKVGDACVCVCACEIYRRFMYFLYVCCAYVQITSVVQVHDDNVARSLKHLGTLGDVGCVWIVGEREAHTHTVTVKNMVSRKQEEVRFSDL
jgi:histidyl-tRNA synthetase